MALLSQMNTALNAHKTLAILKDMTNIMRDELAAYKKHTTNQGWPASNIISILALVISFLGLFWQA